MEKLLIIYLLNGKINPTDVKIEWLENPLSFIVVRTILKLYKNSKQTPTNDDVLTILKTSVSSTEYLKAQAYLKACANVKTTIVPQEVIDNLRTQYTLSQVQGAVTELSESAMDKDMESLKEHANTIQSIVKKGTIAKSVKMGDDIDNNIFMLPASLKSLNDTGNRLCGVTVIGAPSGVGKEQPYSEPVLTPNGWKTMGDLCVGGYVIGSDGLPKEILQIHEHGDKDVYKVNFLDGTSVRCGLEHLWSVTNIEIMTKLIMSTEELIPLVTIYTYTIPSFRIKCTYEVKNYKYKIDEKSFPLKYNSEGKTIASIEKLDYKENSRCISIKSEDNLYVTNGYNLTHNSAFSAEQVVYNWKNGRSSVYFSLELPSKLLEARILANLCEINLGLILQSLLPPDIAKPLSKADKKKISDVKKQLASKDTPDIIIYDNVFTSVDITNLIEKHKEEDNVELFIIDYLNLMQVSSSSDGSTWQSKSKFTISLNTLCLELGIVVILPTQVDIEKTTDGKLTMRTRGTSELLNTASLAMLLYRPPEEEGAGMLILQVVKARNALPATVGLEDRLQFQQFGDLGLI